jgi:hypothetical protein
VDEICRDKSICVQTFLLMEKEVWLIEMADAKRLKILLNENSKLEKMVADEILKNRVLQESL